ncbi:CDK5 regulatory subunit-associated protein 3-like [Mya arenaria]|uniref:CDK5 regulatory subunit-associated protein 3-like n=1 Tax=Mya arenaria TaxID=6604 RepID=UPI0022DEA2F8|nr:CDK5 regulatory subunit-associated protein 3-like [Mya arenaria]XP_052805265.1 CDK5 regulatory subunit-associated protein 3-like [Mya arenaria]
MQEDIGNLPIDIHFNKLLDWLINRRHCKQQWQPASLIVQEKITAELHTLQENEQIKTLVGNGNVTYFTCLELVELLKKTSAGEKNIFGQYSSQQMKAWNDIIRIYEKDGIFLAETAQLIMRNVTYEIPALKKQISRCQQIQKECDKKEADYISKAADLRKKYASSCKELGIKGDKIKSELSALVKDLPKVYEEVAKEAKRLCSAVTYYHDFSAFLMKGELKNLDCVPLLRFVQEHGNVVTYQWNHGCKPVSIQEADFIIDTRDEEEVAEADVIDWDIGGGGGGGDVAEIDFDISGITLESGGTDEGKIDIEVEEMGEEINWGDLDDPAQPTEESAKDGVAVGEEALTILDNPRTRNLFLDDLMELEAFLVQRLAELHNAGNILATSNLQSAPTSIQVDDKLVETMATDVKNIISRLTSVQIQHLMLIRNSPRYVERVKDSLRQTLTLADKMVFYEKEMVSRRDEAINEERELQPRVQELVKKTKVLQKQMEGEISKKYKGRPVNIMGEINTI